MHHTVAISFFWLVEEKILLSRFLLCSYALFTFERLFIRNARLWLIHCQISFSLSLSLCLFSLCVLVDVIIVIAFAQMINEIGPSLFIFAVNLKWLHFCMGFMHRESPQYTQNTHTRARTRPTIKRNFLMRNRNENLVSSASRSDRESR